MNAHRLSHLDRHPEEATPGELALAAAMLLASAAASIGLAVLLVLAIRGGLAA